MPCEREMGKCSKKLRLELGTNKPKTPRVAAATRNQKERGKEQTLKRAFKIMTLLAP